MQESAPAPISAEGNPYPGLRPFSREEAMLFFGRTPHVQKLLNVLGEHRFLAVLGSSGSGKSSLVLAGLIPALEAGMAGEKAGYDWRGTEFQPGRDPLLRLADCLARLEADVSGKPQRIESDRSLLRLQLDRSVNPLHEFRERCSLEPETNLLLVVDQFEEVFRFRDSSESERAVAPGEEARTLSRQERLDAAGRFMEVLLRALEHPRICIVLTMRSEYMGDCAKFPGLAERINESHYLIPRLTRDQMEEAISLPAQLRGGSVEPALVNRLYFDAGASSDQLPLLQHTLARMWNLLPPGGEKKLTLNAYLAEDIGTLAHCLDRHAQAVFAGLSESRQRIAARLFRRLTGRGRQGGDTRRMCDVKEIAALVAADTLASTDSVSAGLSAGEPDPAVLAEVIAVADEFRAASVTMLRPLLIKGQPLTADDTLDITHESVARQWSLLRDQWIPWEMTAAQGYSEYSSQAAERLLPPDDPLFGKQFFMSSSMRNIARAPRWLAFLYPILRSNRRQIERVAKASRTFRDHLDDFSLRSALRWRDSGRPPEPTLLSVYEAKNDRRKTAVTPAKEAAADPLPKSAAWAVRYDDDAAEAFPRTIQYINESEVRRANEVAVKSLLKSAAIMAGLVAAVAVGVVIWAFDRATSAEARIAEAQAREDFANDRSESATALAATAEANSRDAAKRASDADTRATKAAEASTGAQVMLAEASWREGRFLDALPHLAKVRETLGDKMPPVLAHEMPPPVEFAYALKHQKQPRALAASRDGRWLAITFEDTSLELIETATGKSSGKWEPPSQPHAESSGACFVTEGLLLWSDGKLRLLSAPGLTPLPAPAWLKKLEEFAAIATSSMNEEELPEETPPEDMPPPEVTPAPADGPPPPAPPEVPAPSAEEGSLPAGPSAKWRHLMISAGGERIVGILGGRHLAIVPLSPDGGEPILYVPFIASGPRQKLLIDHAALSGDGRIAILCSNAQESRLRALALGDSPAECRWLGEPYEVKAGSSGWAGDPVRGLAVDPQSNPKSVLSDELKFTALLETGELRAFKLRNVPDRAFPVNVRQQAIPQAPPAPRWQLSPDDSVNPPQPRKTQEVTSTAGREFGDSPDFDAGADAWQPSRLAMSALGVPVTVLEQGGQLRCWWNSDGSIGRYPAFQLIRAHDASATAYACAVSPYADWIATCASDHLTRFWKIAPETDRIGDDGPDAPEWKKAGWDGGVPVAWSESESGWSVQHGGSRTPIAIPVIDSAEAPPGIYSAPGTAALLMRPEGLAIYTAANPAAPLGILTIGSDWSQSAGGHLSLSPSGKRYLIHAPGGQPAVFETATGSRIEWALPEAVTGRINFSYHEDTLILAEQEQWTLLPRGQSPQSLKLPEEFEGIIDFGVFLSADGRIASSIVRAKTSEDQPWECLVRQFENGVWQVHHFPLDEVNVPYQQPYRDSVQFSPDGTWIVWSSENRALHRRKLLDKEAPVEKLEVPSRRESLAIAGDGTVLISSESKLLLWKPGASSLQPFGEAAPAKDWRPANAAAASLSSGLILEEGKFTPVLDAQVAGSPPGKWPPDAVATTEAYLAAATSVAASNSFASALWKGGMVMDDALIQNHAFFSLLRWLRKYPDHPMHRLAASGWGDMLSGFTDPPDVPPGSAIPKEKPTTVLQFLATLSPGPKLASAIQMRLIRLAAESNDASAAKKLPAEELAHLAFDMTARTLSPLPLQFIAPAVISPEYPVAFLPIVAGQLPDWRNSWLAAHAALPSPGGKGQPSWHEPARLAAEAAAKLEEQPEITRAFYLRPAYLFSGRLSRLAGGDRAAGDALLRKAADSPCIAPGHREMKALALALLGDFPAAAEALPAPPEGEAENFSPYTPFYRILIDHLKSPPTNSRRPDAAEGAIATRLLEAAENETGRLPAFLLATPELWPLAQRHPELRGLLTAPP